MLVTVNNRLILEIKIVHDLSCHPIYGYLKNYYHFKLRSLMFVTLDKKARLFDELKRIFEEMYRVFVETMP